MFPSRRSTPDGNVGNDTFPIPFPLPRSKEAGLQLQLRQTVPPKKHPPTKHTCKYASVMPYRVRGVYVNCKAIFYAMHSGRFSSVSDAKVAGSFFLPRAHNRKKNRIRKKSPQPQQNTSHKKEKYRTYNPGTLRRKRRRCTTTRDGRCRVDSFYLPRVNRVQPGLVVPLHHQRLPGHHVRAGILGLYSNQGTLVDAGGLS